MTFDAIDRQFRRREVATSGLAAAAAAVGLLSQPPTMVRTAPEVGARTPRLGDLRFWTFRDWGTLRAVAVGSRCTCSPPPTGTDQDWLALAPINTRHQKRLFESLAQAGWRTTTDREDMQRGGTYPDEFSAWRLGEDNLIVALSSEFHDRFLVASVLARRFNLLEKADRIALFQAVLYARGEMPT